MTRPIPMWLYLAGWSLLTIALLNAQYTAHEAIVQAERWRGLYERQTCTVSLPSATPVREIAFANMGYPRALLVAPFHRALDGVVGVLWLLLGVSLIVLAVRLLAEALRWPKSARKPGDV